MQRSASRKTSTFGTKRSISLITREPKSSVRVKTLRDSGETSLTIKTANATFVQIPQQIVISKIQVVGNS